MYIYVVIVDVIFWQLNDAKQTVADLTQAVASVTVDKTKVC